jgi:hypothetical protein
MGLPAGTGSGGIGTATCRIEITYQFGANTAATALLETVTNANSPCTAGPVTLASGDNTLTAPDGAAALLFLPPSDNTTVDVMINDVATSPTLPVLVAFEDPTDANTVTINASAELTGCVAYWL